jgi:hypothetical protein
VQAGGDVVADYNVVAAVILVPLSTHISLETSMEHTLQKDRRVNDMVMLDVVWDKCGLRSRMVLMMSVRSSMVESVSHKPSTRLLCSLQ